MLGGNKHIALLIDQLNTVFPEFDFPPDFGTSIGFGTLEFLSTQPVSIVGLRIILYQRDETLMS